VLARAIGQKNKIALFLIISFTPIFLLSILNIIVRLNLISSNYFVWDAFKFGIFFQSTSFSFLISIQVGQMSRKIQNREYAIQQKIERKTKELSGAIKALEKKETEYNSEIDLAYELQKTLVPSANKSFPLVDFSFFYEFPVKIGGDFFDIIERKDGQVAIYIADASGHGISASLLTFMYRTAFSNVLLTKSSPAETFKEINSQSTNVLVSHQYLTSFLLYIHKEGIIRYSSAGHRPAFLFRRKSNTVEILSTKGFFLGMEKSGFQVEEKSTSIDTGDRILLYTDGILEAENTEGKRWSLENLLDVFWRSQGKSLDGSVNFIKNEWKGFVANTELQDDCTILLLEFQGDKFTKSNTI
jgi:sigma-B regulation protein RsbU (phosphoserine phosphatase)